MLHPQLILFALACGGAAWWAVERQGKLPCFHLALEQLTVSSFPQLSIAQRAQELLAQHTDIRLGGKFKYAGLRAVPRWRRKEACPAIVRQLLDWDWLSKTHRG